VKAISLRAAAVQEVIMTRQNYFAIAGVSAFVAFTWIGGAQVQAAQKLADAMAAAKASPELVSALSKELGATPEQAAGAAGTLFGVAKSRLKEDEFSLVSKAVPGMDALLKAAPSSGGGALGAVTGALSSLGGSSSGLSGAMDSFSKLGLKPEMVAKAVPILTSFVSKSGGANVGSLLAGVLK
jgi:hypothetical protein